MVRIGISSTPSQQTHPGVLDIGAAERMACAGAAVDDTLTTPRYQVQTSDVL
jgi:hypothetical protein